MSSVLDQDGEVDWKVVIDRLREGKPAEIPCERERDYVRRTTQVVKRAENRGVSVEVIRGDGVLLVQPRKVAVGDDGESSAGTEEESPDRVKLERQQRREARRMERKSEGSDNG